MKAIQNIPSNQPEEDISKRYYIGVNPPNVEWIDESQEDYIPGDTGY